MIRTKINSFQDLFRENKYIYLKNHLYNYLLRKKRIEQYLQKESLEFVLEMGCGMSPTVTQIDCIVYSDISLTALKILKSIHKKGLCVVADCANLPFKTATFSHIVCSEVLEHIKDDMTALKESARVLKPSGLSVVTFPHRKFYYGIDDRFVHHYRRYELSEIKSLLKSVGFKPVSIQKVLGPMEKMTMVVVVFCYSMVEKYKGKRTQSGRNFKFEKILIPVFKWINSVYSVLVRLDAFFMPRSLSTVLMIVSILSEKEGKNILK